MYSMHFLVQNMMLFSYSHFSKDCSVSRNKFIAISLSITATSDIKIYHIIQSVRHSLYMMLATIRNNGHLVTQPTCNNFWICRMITAVIVCHFVIMNCILYIYSTNHNFRLKVIYEITLLKPKIYPLHTSLAVSHFSCPVIKPFHSHTCS